MHVGSRRLRRIERSGHCTLDACCGHLVLPGSRKSTFTTKTFLSLFGLETHIVPQILNHKINKVTTKNQDEKGQRSKRDPPIRTVQTSVRETRLYDTVWVYVIRDHRDRDLRHTQARREIAPVTRRRASSFVPDALSRAERLQHRLS